MIYSATIEKSICIFFEILNCIFCPNKIKFWGYKEILKELKQYYIKVFKFNMIFFINVTLIFKITILKAHSERKIFLIFYRNSFILI